MKKLIVILLVFVCTITTVFAAEVNVVKDDNLRDALTQLGVDTNKDGKITAKEAANCQLYTLMLTFKGIESLEGLEYFDNIHNLYLDKNYISNVDPLFGMDNLEMVSLGANKLNVSSVRDTLYKTRVDELRKTGVYVYTGNQIIDWDGSKITKDTPKYRVLYVIARDTDFTVELASGGTTTATYTMSETDIGILREYARLFEMYFEKLSNYQVDLVVDIYETQNKITETSEPGWSNDMNQYSLWGHDIPEIQDMIKHYDVSIVNAYMNDKMHDFAGIAGWDPSTNRGTVFVPYDGIRYPYDINNEPLEGLLAELKKDIVFNAETDTYVHEFTHTLEQYSANNGINTWEFHDALIQGSYTANPFEDSFDFMADYLRGGKNPKDETQTGITSWVYENSRTKVEAGSTAKPTTPELSVTVDRTTSKVTLNWTASDSVSYYKVYRSTSENGVYELINKLPTTTYYEHRTEGTYYYKVEPVLSYPDKVIYGDASNIVSVTISTPKVPDAPTISIKQGERRSMEITWTADEWATGYYLYRSESKNGTYTKIANITLDTKYIDTNLTSGKTYYYKLIAYNGYGLSEESNIVSEIAGVLDAPVLSIEKQGENTFKLSWNAVENATNYAVLRSRYKDGEYECLCSHTTLEYIEQDVPKGTRYYYKVQASNANELYDPSEYSNIVTEAVPGDKVEGKPLVIILRDGPNSVKLMWNWIVGAEGYVVKRSTSENGTYVNIGTATQQQLVTFIDEGLKTGTTYYYKVHAYNEWGISEDSDVVFKLIQPLQAPRAYIEVYEENNFRFYWDTVEDATGYKVYRSTSKNGTYKLITITTIQEYVEEAVPKGTTYYYKVVAYTDKETSAYSNIVRGYVEPDKIPGVPNVEIAKGNNNSLTISWEALDFTDGYYVYYATSKTGKYTKLATVEGTSYTHKKLTYGKTYYYKVVAYNAYEKTGYSNVVSMKVVPNEVTGLKLAPSGSTSVKLSWDKLSNTGYAIYYSTDGETWTYITRTTSNNYTHSGLKSNKGYYYRVRAYQTVSGTKHYGAYSDVVSVKTAPGKTKLTVGTTTNKTLNITLTEVSGADVYEIYRATSKSGTYTKIVTLDEPGTYNDKDVKVGKTYYYKVRVKNEAGIAGSYTSIVSKTVIPAKVENVQMTSANSSTIKIKWDQTEASGYEVYRSTNNKKWTKIKTITKGTTLTNSESGLSSNKTYYYKVRAYKTVGRTKIYGSYSTVIAAKTAPAKPKLTVSTTSNKTLKISVGATGGATIYEIYRSTSKNGTYTLISTSNVAGAYIDEDVIVGKTYYYKARAINNQNMKGSYTSVVSKTVIPAKVANVQMTTANTSSIKISWDETEATGYEVYMSTNNKRWTKVKTITSGTTLSYTNKSLSANKTYYYKVRAYKTVGKTKVYGSYSNVLKTKTAPKAPSLSISNRDYISLNIKVAETKGATKYEIYRATEKNGEYELIATLNKAGTYVDTELLTATTYYYKVRAINSNGSASSYSSIISKKVVPNAPKLTLSTTSKKVKVVVGEVNGAIGYEIYRATSKSGKYSKIGELTDLEAALELMNSTKKGRYYYYKVRCYTLVEGIKVYSSYSSVKYIKSK